MSNYPNIKMYSCSEDVINVEHLDINYAIANHFKIPTITILIDGNINTFLTNVTLTTARINFSAKYTGSVKYNTISTK